MIFNELLREILIGDEDLAKCLTTFNGEPAVFYYSAPGDTQKGWKKGSQYPRIVFYVDMLADMERKSAGTATVEIYCDDAVDIVPEEIETCIKRCFVDQLFIPDSCSAYALAWARTDNFMAKNDNEREPRVYGSEVRFDIIEYTNQETTDPDPVVAMNKFIAERVEEAKVLWWDKIEEKSIRPDAKHPVFYCRLNTISNAGEDTYTVAWMNGNISIHVLCPDSVMRKKWTAQVLNALSMEGEVEMLDYSPMTITQIELNSNLDYLKNGQLAVSVHYGLLKALEKGKTLRGANESYQFGD